MIDSLSIGLRGVHSECVKARATRSVGAIAAVPKAVAGRAVNAVFYRYTYVQCTYTTNRAPLIIIIIVLYKISNQKDGGDKDA